jgi:serine/threonine-protein kinase
MITGGPVGNGDLVVKLTDFGIARAIEQTRITQVGSVVGTAAYLSPEQVRGDEATPATDVYALGVVLYQFLTGRLPYEGSSLAELAVRQQNEKPLPPSTYNSEVPEPLSAAVLRALEGDTNRRYASADEFATGLQMGLEGEDVTSLDNFGGGNTPTRVIGGDTAATRHLDRTTAQTEYRPAPPPARRIEPRRQPEARRSAPYAGDPHAQASSPYQAPAQPRKRSAFSRFVRFVLALIALVLVAGAVATGVILTTDKAAGVHISKVAGDTVDKVVEEFKGLVSKNKE